jgi:Zn-dependent protease with chaperone function
MIYLVRLIPLVVTLALVAALIVFANAHSWSDSATQWAITAILGGSTIIDLAVARWRERSSRSHGEDRATPHHVR